MKLHQNSGIVQQFVCKLLHLFLYNNNLQQHQEENKVRIIEELVEIIDPRRCYNSKVQLSACRTLARVCAINEEYPNLIVQAGGIEAMVDAFVQSHGQNIVLQNEICRILKRLSRLGEGIRARIDAIAPPGEHFYY